MVEAWARDQALEASYTDLLLHPEVAARVQAAVDGVNAALSRPEQIRRWILLDRDLSPEEEELTPTLKLRRAVVEAKFRDRLDALYS
jgi:long-chain acyl-CoA synthetase